MSDNFGAFQSSKREVQTVVSVEMEMSIRKADWKRVYRKIKAVPNEKSIYEMMESLAWGVSGSALLSLIPLYQAASSTEAWVKPTFWIVTGSAAIIALLSGHFARGRRQMIKVSCEEIMLDMREVYGAFFQDGQLEDA